MADPRELDLAGHGRRWREGEGGEVARRRGSGATYRPESTWVRGVVPGGGGFGSGAHVGERAERAGGAAHGGGGVAARERVWDACARGKVPRGGPGGAGGLPGSIWPWTRCGRGPPAAYGGRRRNRASREDRDGDKGISVISKIPGTSR